MKFIRNLKIRNKLLVLLFILLIPLLYFVILNIEKEADENRELKNVRLRLVESKLISEVIHQFQKERARILAASAGDPGFMLEARQQRQNTNAAERKLKEFLEENHRAFTDIALIYELEKYRIALDQKGTVDIEEFRKYTNNIIFVFLDRISDNASGISNIPIRRQMLSFVRLISAKIQLSRLRSLLVRIMQVQQGKLKTKDYGLFTSQKDFYEQALHEFKIYGTQEAVNDLNKRISGSGYTQVMSVIQSLENNPDFDLSIYGIRELFKSFTDSVENIKASEDQLMMDIQNAVDEAGASKKRNLAFYILLIITSLGLATILSVYIIKLIASSLTVLRRAADRVALGATDISIDISSHDEVGQLADSFKKVVHKNIHLSKVAQAIGQGVYDVKVEVMSPEDMLGHSIREMKDNLVHFTRENENRNWILNGMAKLNNLGSGESDLARISYDIISFLCSYTQSEVGLLYLLNDTGTLVPSAAYGINGKLEEIQSFTLGSGVIGQAGADKKQKILTKVSGEYIKIETGISGTYPANILVLPLVFSDNLIGVIEIGTREVYSPMQQEFFATAGERIAIVIHTIKTHLHTQELLYETQNQAEELVTQQEELRQLNAELKTSEEELKVSQEELQEKNSELEEKAQLLEEQYEAIRTKNKALEDARHAIELKVQQVETVSKYKSEFLANMSHELRTPLNSILILSRLLSDNTEKNLTARQEEHARIIHNSGSDLLKLINDILDLSKIEAGRVKLEVKEMKVRELSIDETFRELARNRNITFEIRFADPDMTIQTDKFRLEQVLKNFLSNAFKFTEMGGSVILSAGKAKPGTAFRTESLRRIKDVVAFSVTDTGIGIPKEKQALIFEAFQQADTSTTRKYGGTGLGLTISKELSALLGGEIAVESEAGKGSTFTLYIPATYQEEQSMPTPVQPEKSFQPHEMPSVLSKPEGLVTEALQKMQPTGKKEVCLLIIEDDKGFCKILSDFALAKNFKVHQAYEGKKGLKLARQLKPDAILLDIHLPDISGWEVLREIREDKDLKGTNVHVMSAYDKEIADKYLEAEEYLSKPVTLEMLDKAFADISGLRDSSIETVMIVEDNEGENKAVAELLRSHNIKSVSAFSAEEADRALSKYKIDCIILDLNLPGMKGYEWMEKVRNRQGDAGVPIIVYSGKDLSEEEEVRLKKFANTIIIKNEYSYIRLLDEVQLFLYKVNQRFPQGNAFKMKLHVPEEILKDKKALVVDDDVRNVYSLYSLLEMHGMQVISANDGKEALDKLQTEKGIDIVLMDVMMPEMDGIEATQKIRQNPQFKSLPIIALTAKAMKGDRERCIEAGASDYIPKPVDSDKLLSLMRIWLYES